MSTFTGRFLSIVFLGRQNPQILNHDFLITHGVLPKDKAPFKELFAKKDGQPFTEFISTPVLSSIKYGSISITIEEGRFQIIDNKFENPPASPIIEITKNYFGRLLRYTPLQIGGINLNGIIQFANDEEEQGLATRLGISRESLSKTTGASDLQIGVSFSFAWKAGRIGVRLPQPKEDSKERDLHFNYEFKCEDIDSSLGHLDEIGQVCEKFNNLLNSLNIERAS